MFILVVNGWWVDNDGRNDKIIWWVKMVYNYSVRMVIVFEGMWLVFENNNFLSFLGFFIGNYYIFFFFYLS